MGTYEELKATIAQYIKQNGNNDITGNLLQSILTTIVSNLGVAATFWGSAGPNGSAPITDSNIFLVASTPGTYVNFNNIVVAQGEIAALCNYTGQWTKITLANITDQTPVKIKNNINAIMWGFSFYDVPAGTSRINIDTVNRVVNWVGPTNCFLYSIDQAAAVREIFIQTSGSAAFNEPDGGSPNSYAYYLFGHLNGAYFDDFVVVEYSKLAATGYLGNQSYILFGYGSFDDPQTRFFCGGPISIDGVVYSPTNKVVSGSQSEKLVGKKLSILGDSISTFQGYLASDAAGYDGAAYAYWYPRGNVQSVENTWWKQLINETGMTLLKNCAWSDSEVEGNSQATNTALAGCSDRRIADLANGATTPDIVICYIGVNDWGHDKALGTFNENSEIPSEGVITNFADAYMIMVDKIQRTYPLARVFCCTLLNCGYTGYDVGNPGVYPAINENNVALNSFNNVIINVANCLGAEIIDIRKCGFTFHNFTQYTIGDKLHPNIAGMELLKNFIKNQLELLY